MGEEEKKPEEKKPEESAKKEESAPAADKPPPPPPQDVKKETEAEKKKPDESKAAETPPPPPPPPQEIVLKVFMHCEGCARKVRRCLKGFEGVEDVITDCRTSKVVVKGEKADPLKVLERVQRKSHRQVQLMSPIPKPPPPEDKKEEAAPPKPEEKKEEPPVITVVLGVYMHCEACAQEIKKRILRMKGVESAEPDLKSSQVAVKGVFEPEKLADYIHKRTGKHAMIVKVEPEKKEDAPAEKPKEGKEAEKKPEEPEKAETKKPDGEAAAAAKESGSGETTAADEAAAEDPKLELRKNEFNYYYPHNNSSYYYDHHHHQQQQQQQQVNYPQRVVQEYNNYAYPPQMFSDENPNACSLM